jgi:hypothetical protein
VGPVDGGGVEDGRAGEGSWGSEMKNEAVLVLMGWGGGSAQRKRSEGESLRSFSARRRVAAGSGAIAASGWCVAAIQVLAGAACESCGFYSTSSYPLCFSISVCFIVLSSIAVHPLLLNAEPLQPVPALPARLRSWALESGVSAKCLPTAAASCTTYSGGTVPTWHSKERYGWP